METKPEETNVLLTCSVLLIIVGWTIFHGCSDRSMFSLFGVMGMVALLIGWGILTFVISDRFEDQNIMYAGIACGIMSAAIAIPYLGGIRRNVVSVGILWGGFVLTHSLFAHFTAATKRPESTAIFASIGAIVIGAALQFGQRRLNFEWVQTGRFNPYNTVFSLGTVLNAFGWGAIPFVFGKVI